jgi:hypothetical protein
MEANTERMRRTALRLERLFYLRSRLETLLQVLKNRIRDEARAAFTAVAKLQIYREQMGASRFAKAVLGALGVPEFYPRYVGETIARPFRSLARAVLGRRRASAPGSLTELCTESLGQTTSH